MPFIPDNTALQEMINNANKQATTGLGKVFDTLLDMKLTEQKNAKEQFDAILKANPALGSMIAKHNPSLIEAMTTVPKAIDIGKKRQGPPTETGKGPGRATEPPVGKRLGEAVAAEGDQANAEKVTTLRLIQKDVIDILQNAEAAGVSIPDKQGFAMGYFKAMAAGRQPTPSDVGLSAEDYGKAISAAVPKTKNLDLFTELVSRWKQENGTTPNFDELQRIGGLAYPATEAERVALQNTLNTLRIEEMKKQAKITDDLLDQINHGKRLTAEQRAQQISFAERNRPVVDALQRIDNNWDKLVKNDKATKKELELLMIPLLSDPELKSAALQLLTGQFSANTRTFLNQTLAKRLETLHKTEQILQRNRQPLPEGRGESEEEAPITPEEYLQSITPESEPESEQE